MLGNRYTLTPPTDCTALKFKKSTERGWFIKRWRNYAKTLSIERQGFLSKLLENEEEALEFIGYKDPSVDHWEPSTDRELAIYNGNPYVNKDSFYLYDRIEMLERKLNTFLDKSLQQQSPQRSISELYDHTKHFC